MPEFSAKDINVVGRNDSFLGGEGIGAVTVTSTGDITQVRCGIFGTNQGIPTVGEEYSVSGEYDPERKIQFKKILTCTTSGRPQSIFGL